MHREASEPPAFLTAGQHHRRRATPLNASPRRPEHPSQCEYRSRAEKDAMFDGLLVDTSPDGCQDPLRKLSHGSRDHRDT
jgi:hypothetical protein